MLQFSAHSDGGAGDVAAAAARSKAGKVRLALAPPLASHRLTQPCARVLVQTYVDIEVTLVGLNGTTRETLLIPGPGGGRRTRACVR